MKLFNSKLNNSKTLLVSNSTCCIFLFCFILRNNENQTLFYTSYKLVPLDVKSGSLFINSCVFRLAHLESVCTYNTLF